MIVGASDRNTVVVLSVDGKAMQAPVIVPDTKADVDTELTGFREVNDLAVLLSKELHGLA